MKEKYGIPLNTKASDELVYRYQTRKEQGVSDEDMPNWIKYYAMRQVDAIEHGRKTGLLSYAAVNKKTCEAMMAGTLHKVSNLCCKYLKKEAGKRFAKESGLKSINGIMGDESWKRKTTFKSCFSKNGEFHPLFDLTEELRNKIEEYYGIPVPSIYKYVKQTGCAGCPYGQHGKGHGFQNTNLELSLCSDGQRKFILDYFAESYAFKGYTFQPRLFM